MLVAAFLGQVCVMIHSGSRGLGHQVATDSLVKMEQAMARDKIAVNDRQLACARIQSPEGQEYLKGMAAAANYAWVNRSSMTFLTRQVRNLFLCTVAGGNQGVAYGALVELVTLVNCRLLQRLSIRRQTISTCMSSMTCHTT